jgi:hypothetical protein
VEALAAAIDARIAARPDPRPTRPARTRLLARGEYDAAAKLAEALVPATATFVEENLGSYKLQGKATASVNRARATSLDLVGWTLFLKGDWRAPRPSCSRPSASRAAGTSPTRSGWRSSSRRRRETTLRASTI